MAVIPWGYVVEVWLRRVVWWCPDCGRGAMVLRWSIGTCVEHECGWVGLLEVFEFPAGAERLGRWCP